MRRGEIYRVVKPHDDPKRHRCYLVVSRQELIDSEYSTAICAPIFTRDRRLSTQVVIGIDEGMKHESRVVCDNLRSIHKSALTQFVGSLPRAKMAEVELALAIALGID